MEEQYKTLGGSLGTTGIGVYNNQTSKVSAPRDKSTMDVAIDQLSAEISTAEMNFQCLGSKLKPVRSSGENSGADGKPTPGPHCELEERILQLAHRVSMLSGDINSVTAQVCL